MAKPEIRLKGFEGEWKNVPFSKSFIFLKNNSLSRAELGFEDGDIKNVHYGDVLIKYGEILDISVAKVPVIQYAHTPNNIGTDYRLENGDIIIADAAEDNTVGKCTEIRGIVGDAKCVSGLHTIPCRPLFKYQDGYLGYYLNSNSYHNQLLPQIQGTKISSISKKALCSTSLSYPDCPDEQKELADYFKSLDSMIQAATKKIESLKQMKSACLVSMFPQAGETTPRVRFQGFNGEWEKKLFCELYEPSSIKNEFYGTDKIISVANMYFKPVSYISDEDYLKSYNVMCLGDIAFEGNKSKNFAHGRFVENTIGDGIVSHVFVVLKPISKKYDLLFWKYLINDERIMGPILLRSTKHSTMMTDIVVADFLKESILVPSYEEQKKIGAFFESLDKQISMQEKRLEKLKQIKAACLDKMFV